METASTNNLRLRLEADGKPGLYELYAGAAGAVIGGRFRLDRPFAAGRQALLYEATEIETGRAVLVKQVAFDYRRPIQYSRAAAAGLRHALWLEYQALAACQTGHLPAPLALLTTASPVPAAAGSNVLGQNEVFLVEERIDALTLDAHAATVLPGLPPARREQAARLVAREVLSFWSALARAGYHYSDLNAQNILIEKGTGRVRLVDAACVVPVADRIVVREFTPAFLTPQLHAALTSGTPVPASLAVVLPVLAKILYFILTGKTPFNGALPDWNAPEISPYSPALRTALRCMANVDGDESLLPEAARGAAPILGELS
jgi:hypothetical protein